MTYIFGELLEKLLPSIAPSRHAGSSDTTRGGRPGDVWTWTDGFSKKVENHAHAVALYFVHYNFARIHKTLRVTPAMAAGLADHIWSIEEIIGLLDAVERKAA